MKVFLDTNILIAAMVEDHGDHERAYAVMERVQSQKDEGVISGHSLAETYSILTRLPPPNRFTPEQALLSIEQNILKYFDTVTLSGSEYAEIIREAGALGVVGGTIYDAALMRTADKAEVGRVYTLNLKHFQAVASRELAAILCIP